MNEDEDRAPLAIDQWPYIQVAERLDRRIRDGEFGSGGKLPASPELAEWYGVSLAVISHAREELKRRGLVVTMPGYGTFTRPAAEKPAE